MRSGLGHLSSEDVVHYAQAAGMTEVFSPAFATVVSPTSRSAKTSSPCPKASSRSRRCWSRFPCWARSERFRRTSTSR